jgi:hypothetical protein
MRKGDERTASRPSGRSKLQRSLWGSVAPWGGRTASHWKQPEHRLPQARMLAAIAANRAVCDLDMTADELAANAPDVSSFKRCL